MDTMGWILSLPPDIAVLLVAGMPIFELRGAIPLGFYLKLPPLKIFILSLIGNMLPILPLMFLLKPVSRRLRGISIFKIFFDWLFKHTRQKARLVEKYEALGLALFVAIPFPMTGAWTGAIAASLFKIRIRYAFVAIFIGVITAGIIVSFLCLLGKLTWNVYR